MKQFKLTAKIVISTYTTVEAETLEEALEIAEQRADMMQITSNNGDSEEECWMVDELDGTPSEIQEQ